MNRVLVIDGVSGIRKSLSLLLEGNGFGVSAYPNTSLALSHLQEEGPFDLLVINSSNCDDILFVEQLKGENPSLKVLIMTGGTSTLYHGEIKASSQACVNKLKKIAHDSIAKPFTSKEFLTRIEKILKK